MRARDAGIRRACDIVLTGPRALARTTKPLAMTSDGNPWRPRAHDREACGAVYRRLVTHEEACELTSDPGAGDKLDGDLCWS